MNSFFASLYEVVFQFYQAGFSDDLSEQSVYSVVGTTTIIVAFLVNALYYFVLNRPSLARWTYWLLFGSVNSVLLFFFGWFYTANQFETEGLQYDTADFISFGMFTGLSAFIFYIVGMLLMRWFSTNCKSVPFPS